MALQTLYKLFERDLDRLYTEISKYTNENNLWITDKQIPNSGGNLCLHLIGNLNTYIGKDLGGSGYVRNRDAEFALKNVPRAELMKKITSTKEIVLNTIANLTEADLQKEPKDKVFDHPATVEYLLIHLTTHLTYHLGQINYHRRFLDN